MYEARFDTEVDTKVVIGCSNSFKKLSKTFMAIAAVLYFRASFISWTVTLLRASTALTQLGVFASSPGLSRQALRVHRKLIPMIEKLADCFGLTAGVGLIAAGEA